jgi:HEAT repeat protein
MALLSGTDPNEYAHHLVEIAASVAGRSGVAPVLTMADKCGLRSRVNHVLTPHSCRSRLGQTGVLTIAAVILATAVLLASAVISADPTTIPATSMLIDDLRDAPSVSARCRAAWWLGEHEDWDAVVPLTAALDDPFPEVRLVTAWALGEIKDRASIDALVESLDDSDLYVREMAVLALGEIEHPSAIRPLNETYKRDKEMGGAVAWALGEIGTSRARSLQRKILKDLGKTSLQTNQVWIGELEDRRDLKLVPSDLDDLIDQVHDDDAKIRRLAALKIGIIGVRQEFESLDEVEDAVDALISVLRDPDPRVRAVAVWSLDEINPSRVVHFWNR